MNKLSAAVFTFFLSSFAFSHDHQMGSVKGPDIDLKFSEHAVSGSIKNHLIFGYKLSNPFGAKLHLRKNNQTIESSFKKVGDQFIGQIKTKNNLGEIKTTTIEFIRIDKEQQVIILKLNDKEINIEIQADRIEGKHFINPRYIVNLENQEEIMIKMDNSQACYGCSLALMYIIIGSYVHLD